MTVGALHGADALGQRQAGFAPVGHRARKGAKINMASRRQHLDPIVPAPGIRTAINFLEAGVEDLQHQAVGIIIVVAVLPCPIHQALAQDLLVLRSPAAAPRPVAPVASKPPELPHCHYPAGQSRAV